MKTVFVIGAGASSEAGMPTGETLKLKIINSLNFSFDDDYKLVSGDGIIFRTLELLSRKESRNNIDYINAAKHIRDALPLVLSIDNFIETHKDNEKIVLCSKLAIVRSILEAESSSRFVSREGCKFNYLDNTWYLPFFQLLNENCWKNNIEKRLSNITLIIFNYDRCIEHFLYYSFQNLYGKSEKEASELVGKINIFHPYGVVGALPWSDATGIKMVFGKSPNTQELLDLAGKIKTFTEGTNPEDSDIVAIRREMGSANRIIFLGYAFHKLNMELIKPAIEQRVSSNIKCYASTFEISDSDKIIIESQIRSLYPPRAINIKMANKKCYEFFKDYWRSLSF